MIVGITNLNQRITQHASAEYQQRPALPAQAGGLFATELMYYSGFPLSPALAATSLPHQSDTIPPPYVARTLLHCHSNNVTERANGGMQSEMGSILAR